MANLKNISDRLDRIFYFLTWVFSLYLALSVFEFLLPNSQHYALFLSGIVILSSILFLRDMLRKCAILGGAGVRIRIGAACLLLLLAILTAGYLIFHATRLEIDQPFISNLDIAVGIVLLGVIMVLNWFYWGGILTTVIIATILYFYLGHLIGNPILRHPPYDLSFIISYMGMNTTEGLFAYLPNGVEKLYFLVLFSAVLIGGGMIGLVVEMGKLMGRSIRGGAAFPAIVGSTLVGTVMGAAVTNVILTGRLTIPMMKQHGFTPSFAGAIEAAASTAGQIIPPIMGLAAFIMAAFLDIPYITVVLVAVIPSLLYITGVTIAVLVRARRDKLPIFTESVNVYMIGKLFPTFIVPFIIILTLMLLYYSPSFAGLFGILAILVLTFFQGPFRPNHQQMREGLHDGFVVVIQLSLLLLAIGPLAQTFVTTNMAGRLSSFFILIFPQNQLFLLFIAMALALFLGMGLPTPAAYILGALTLGHFLQETGIKAIPAHFFIQYFAVFSALTPPVALASMAAAKVSKARFVETAIESIKLVLPAFFVPFAFIFHPELLSFPKVTLSLFITMGVVIGVQWSWAIGIYGFLGRNLNVIERGIFFSICAVGVLYLFRPNLIFLYIFGAGCAFIVGWWRIVGEEKDPEKSPSAKGGLTEEPPVAYPSVDQKPE
jgi:TRAP transporter 4TM/12TM fusion protein